ncbi:MAG: aromatic ring-hydroxylating dioxygenase subunit alpha [Lachnospiraceae bacterium]|nr:aromatic ring-hydroxylating dioxygenase subunit alpha [Lachnospiraceae bacterium]
MIKDQWYAILWSKELKEGKAVGVKRFGEKLLLYRDESGRANCVADACAHRGASLSKGCVRSGRIQCPFHGIEYGRDGSCVFIPSEGRAAGNDYKRFKLKCYKTYEAGDIIFVWYGEGEPEGKPDYFEIIEDKSFVYSHFNDHWGVDYSRVIENQLDVSHLAFVHKSTIGRGGKSLVNGPKVIWLDENTLQTSANNEVDRGQTPKSAEESIIKNTNLTFKFPNMWLNHITDKIMVLAFFIPVDDENSIIALRFYNRITGIRAIDSFIALFGKWANKIIERQDKRIVETQLPKKSSLRMNEKLVSADMPIIKYRERREELIKKA